MKKLLSSFLPAIALVFSFIPKDGFARQRQSAEPVVQKSPAPFAKSARARIDSLMKAHFSADGPGVVLAVQQGVRATGKKSATQRFLPDTSRSISFAAGVVSLKSKIPVSASSVFNIGSLTKQFTAREVLLLVAENKCSLTDPIGKYLQGLAPAIASLKIYRLLSHSSGIPDHYGFTDTNNVKHATDKDVLDAIRKAERTYFPEGTQFRYSNTAYCLLGMLIEKCTGLSYETAMKRDLEFSGPESFSFLQHNSVIGNRVHGYEKNKAGSWVSADAPESIFFTTQADGGMLISMQNYMSWCASLNLERHSDKLPIQLGRTFNKAFPEFTPRTIIDSVTHMGYGFGWFVLPRISPNGPLIFHSGFNGGFRTAVLLIPGLDYRIAIFSASPGVDLEELIHQIDVILGVDDKGFIKSGPLES